MPHYAAVSFLCAAAAASAQTITYSEHIAPIIYKNCTPCHRAGQVAPFTLTSYDDAFTHARTIATVTQSRQMPPWKPEPGWASFRDERRLTPDQIALFQQWVAGNMPEGDPSKAPSLPSFPDGWQLGTPDLILTMPAGFSVPAESDDIYRNFVLPTGLTEDRWIRAVELKPSARAAVHHVLFFSDTTGKARALDGQDGQPGFPGFGTILTLEATGNNPLSALSGGLGGWVPGTTPEFLPDGIAYSLPKGADLILQSHFHPDGKSETEQTVVGLYFAQKPARDIMQIQAPAFFGIQAHLDIPAGQNDYLVRGSFTLPVDVDAFSVSAHAHYLGKGARMTATLPTGDVKILLWIKDWDFSWQDSYIFNGLVSLPAGARIDGELIYDNSANNPRNPFSPPREVKWGENSTDEMGSLILNIVPHREADLFALQTAVAAYSLSSAPKAGSKPLFVGAGMVDGASALAGAVTPGKIFVLYGTRIGPSAATGPQITSDGKAAEALAGVQVLFDGSPAPLLYAYPGQIALVAPYALAGKSGTQVTVNNGSTVSDLVALPVTAAAPSIFSADYSGIGQGAILNADLSVNSSASPAQTGSIVAIYATGEGQTIPAGVDGLLAIGPVYPAPELPVSVNIGGLAADVVYAGAAPSLVAGVLQVNARVPSGVPPGNAPVVVTVGGTASQPGVTIAVK